MASRKPGVKLSNRQVRKFLEDIVGKSALLVIHACDMKDGVTDEVIVSKTGLKLSAVRNTLNQLHDRGLIRYNREKDQNTNWYTYTWFACKDKIGDVVRDQWQVKLSELDTKFDFESNHIFYKCTNGCQKLAFELAAEYDFKCPDCGNELQNIDNRETITLLIGEMKELKDLVRKIGA
jgi:transcription initiation factor TFIIE subunit alpha